MYSRSDDQGQSLPNHLFPPEGWAAELLALREGGKQGQSLLLAVQWRPRPRGEDRMGGGGCGRGRGDFREGEGQK